tara:strand:- start:301 stop:516 length:216 start_codon:yes stop_codon:yes gene_type:complete
MKSVNTITKNIKNSIPYLSLIAIYFLFVNIEAQKDQSIYENKKISEEKQKIKLDSSDKNLRLSIPVIPYNQ